MDSSKSLQDASESREAIRLFPSDHHITPFKALSSSNSSDSLSGNEETEEEKRRLDNLGKSHMSERSEIELKSDDLAKLAFEAGELIPLLRDSSKEDKVVLYEFVQKAPLALASAPDDDEDYPHLMKFSEFLLRSHNFEALKIVEDGVGLFLTFYNQWLFYKPFKRVLASTIWQKLESSTVKILNGLGRISDRKLSYTIAHKVMAEIDFDTADKNIRDCLLHMLSGQKKSGVSDIHSSTGLSNPERNYLVSTPNIPTSSDMSAKNLAVINQYFRDCNTKGCETRFDAWPEALKQNIQWIWQGSDLQKPDFASAHEQWQQVPLDILIKWMDGIISSPTIINGVQAFKDWVNSHPIIFDTDSDNNAISGTFALNMQQYSLLWSRIEQDQTLSQSISDVDQKVLVTELQQKLKVVGKTIIQIEATKTMRRRILDQIRTTVHKDHLPEQYEQQIVRDKVKRNQSMVKPYLLGTQQAFQAYLSLKSNLTVEWAGMFSLTGKNTDDSQSFKRDSSSELKGANKQRDMTNKKVSHTSQETCNGCGLFLKSKNGGPETCPRNFFKGCSTDDRRNKDTATKWSSSKTGKEWKQKFNLDFLPQNPAVTLSNARKREEKDSNPLKSKDYSVHALSCIDSITNDENILHFSLFDLQEQKSKKFRANTSQSIGLLDSGAIGCSIISPSFKSFIEMNNYILCAKDVIYDLHAPLTNNKTMIANQKFTFDIFVHSERQHTQLVKISVQAIVAPINFDLILDRDTIKANDLIAHFPSHFTKGKLLQQLLDIDLPGIKKRKREDKLELETTENRYQVQLAAIASKHRTLFKRTERSKLKQELYKLRQSRRF